MSRVAQPRDARATGDGWCPDIPSDWSYLPLRRLGRIINGGTPSSDAGNWNGEIPFITPPDLRPVGGRYVRTTERFLTHAGVASGSSIAPPGAVIASIRAPIGYVAKVQRESAFNQGCRVLAPNESVDVDYLAYTLLAACQELDAQGRGTTFMELSAAQFAAIRVPLPELSEQRAIADYLDHETAQIDTLIAKQEALIETLRERMAGVVSDAVWNGLDRDAPHDVTGIATVPSAPTRWRRLRNKVLLAERTDVTDTGKEELLSVSHLTGVTPRSEKNVTMFEAESNVGYRHVSPGDLVINTMWAWMGAMGISRHEGIVSPAYGVYSYRSTYEIYPPYFDYLYRTPEYITEMTRWSRGITSSRLRLYPEVFLSLAIVVPPIDEQQRIADHLDEKTAATRALIDKAQRFIDLARERRAALITAAVTGQIDVRERVA